MTTFVNPSLISATGSTAGQVLMSGGTTTTWAAGCPIFQSVVALRANTTSNLSVCEVVSYYGLATATQSQGKYHANTSDTTSADNGGTIIVDASGSRWYLLSSTGTYTVDQFGAYGDGVHVDTTAINNAIAWVSTTTNGTLGFTHGTYLANITLLDNVTLVGISYESPSISWSGKCPILIVGQGGNVPVINATNVNNNTVGVVNLAVTGGISSGVYTNTIGINIPNAGTIHNCSVTNTYYQGVYVGGVGANIRNLFITDALKARAAITSQMGALHIANYSDHIVSDIEVQVGNQNYGNTYSSLNLYCAAIYVNAANCFFDKCIGELSDIGWFITGASFLTVMVN